MPIVKLSQTFITQNLQCNNGKLRIEYCDSELPGLYVEVRTASQGQGTFWYRFKDANKKTCHVKVGRTTDIDLIAARKQAKTLRAEIALGRDPNGEKQARKEVLTFSDFFENHYLPYVTPRNRSWQKDQGLYQLRLASVFGDKRLNQITRQSIQSFHTELLAKGLAPATCDHHVKLMRHTLNLAVDWGMLEKSPITKIPLFNRDNRVEHYLDDAQLENLLNVLRTDENRSVCLIAMFLLSTGARLNEALQARWDQVSREQRVWRISASTSKSKRIRSVPLNDSAIDILNQLDTEGTFDYLFINHKTGKRFVNIHKAWGRLRKKAGCAKTRLHDLRHQYASFLVNSGRSLYEVQQILGHSSPMVTQRYAHLSSKSLQDAANSASVIIKGSTPARSQQAESEVVS